LNQGRVFDDGYLLAGPGLDFENGVECARDGGLDGDALDNTLPESRQLMSDFIVARRRFAAVQRPT
jgi:hypothetical protein